MSSVLTDPKIIYLYHPLHAETKRIDLKLESAASDLEAATRAGWSRQRFAQVLFHQRHGQKIYRTPEDVKKALKTGWQEKPIIAADRQEAVKNGIVQTVFTDSKGVIIHPGAVNVHQFDEHHLAAVADQEQPVS